MKNFISFFRNDVWELVPRPTGVNVIGTKWILKNKSDEHGTVIRNKSRLVAQGYTQVEGINFNETFADTFGHSKLFEFQVVSNGCQECFLESNVARRGIC